ncbi:hypothetical protein BaRGS_00004333 [Batillaria attramentaria]|uniref:Uncharacterized protein n=1 Tax=Batillaria attramentaria TaxID=370345 RepID=A0ABD0LY92_9CAEN
MDLLEACRPHARNSCLPLGTAEYIETLRGYSSTGTATPITGTSLCQGELCAPNRSLVPASRRLMRKVEQRRVEAGLRHAQLIAATTESDINTRLSEW